MGAIRESTTIRCGFAGTVWYEPGIGSPSLFVSYLPAGMIQVSRATRTIRMKRIVYADGSAKRDLPVSGDAAAAVMRVLLPGSGSPRGHRGAALPVAPRSRSAG